MPFNEKDKAQNPNQKTNIDQKSGQQQQKQQQQQQQQPNRSNQGGAAKPNVGGTDKDENLGKKKEDLNKKW